MGSDGLILKFYVTVTPMILSLKSFMLRPQRTRGCRCKTTTAM